MRDEQAFIALYRQHQRGLYRFVYHMTGNAHTAEEVVQEAFVTLLRKSVTLLGKSGMTDERAYLFGIARNLVHRGWESAPALELSDEIPVAPAVLDDLAQAEREEAVRVAIGQLPQVYREAVLLCDMEEMSYTEAARILKCPVGTVRSRLNRGRQILVERLRSRFADQYPLVEKRSV
ncbi:MAG: sigma-70 family RNA polymerase sigma factor [Acidobacteria bacterium]|nr:sigma-70 family RNA polymerase sigma factor [Acidobacteriota bacterium]